jgi:micrococcal nuclease
MYEYRATLLNVVDGDTIDVQISLGLDIFHQTRLRLADINAPELHAADPAVRAKAKAARQFLIDNLPIGAGSLTIDTVKDRTEKYGRYLAHIRVGDAAETINQQLVDKGLAVPFMVDQ